jgi:hypothetical protein
MQITSPIMDNHPWPRIGPPHLFRNLSIYDLISCNLQQYFWGQFFVVFWEKRKRDKFDFFASDFF